METSYSKSYSPDFVSRAGPARTDLESIRDQVHALNESVQRQLEEADWRYMELYECHERDKQQCSQQIQSIEQMMMTLYSFYEQMWSDNSLSPTPPPPPPPPPPPLPSLPHLELETTTTAATSPILTMINICRFQAFFFFKNCIVNIFLMILYIFLFN